ncbi:probable hexosyltransferase MUCI70 [Quercus robur]|uniref:probable hexosyltransferase MUCI70 n=1 Tax=Quercus robur TaxID=38942 RepID=UPI002161DE24|nr:probable hexosyltransferase MUCI70 [Quercus robur]
MSMAGSNGVSISVSDEEECDELGRTRARVRRKRKKPSYRAKSELAQRVIRWLVKYWLFLVFVPATVLLLYEASRVGRKTSPEIDSKHSSERARVEKRPMMNLNRLEPKYRFVHGVRERCLKLLPQEDLEHLDIPVDEGSTGPVNKVLYISERDSLDLEGSTVLSSQFTETTRFNLFTGNQTLDQREKSFKVNETAMVHCGFYSDNGGFKISNEDKNYMERCEVVVSTCAFGGGDDLYQPIGMTGASVRKVCFVAFWDDITLSAQEYAKQTIGEDGFIGKWRIVVVKELPFTDQRLNGKIPKMLSHRLFPHAKYSIWVDSKSQFRRDPLGVLEALLWRSNSILAISEHGARSSVYDEAKAVVNKNKATPEEVEVQLTQYRLDGFPEDKRFNGKKALAEASVIVREHTPLSNLFMCLWFNEVVRFTSRDQLSFPYVLWRLKVPQNIHLFPVCIRKDLVNSMGHIRKARPLIR